MNHVGSNMPLLRSLVVGLTCVTINMPLLTELSAPPRCLGCTGRNACKVQAANPARQNPLGVLRRGFDLLAAHTGKPGEEVGKAKALHHTRLILLRT